MRLGLLTDATTGTIYNLNPTASRLMARPIPELLWIPRALGINPLISQLWSKYEPLSNESGIAPNPSICDGVNLQGLQANVGVPQKDNFGVVRVDHDFSDKWHFMSSYRYYSLSSRTIDQVDIGGFFPGDKLGVPSSQSNNPQAPWYLVAGLTPTSPPTPPTTSITAFCAIGGTGAGGRYDTVSGLGGALEPFGESRDNFWLPTT